MQVIKVDQESEQLNVQGKNFSNSGLLFESPVAIKIGTQIQIQIADKGISKPIIVKAQVARVEKFKSYYDIGVSFVEVDDTDGNEIAQALAKPGNPRQLTQSKKEPGKLRPGREQIKGVLRFQYPVCQPGMKPITSGTIFLDLQNL